jgi:hypothetical protein
MQPLWKQRAVPLFDQSGTVPPSRPKFDPPPRAAAVKSLPAGYAARGGRQAGALPRPPDGRIAVALRTAHRIGRRAKSRSVRRSTAFA